MKRCLNVIGIFLLLQFFPYCANQEAQKNEGRGSSAHAALAEIDSLMWWRADSAFVLLQEFVVSPEAKELDTFDGHYCQLLISELLYKNDCEQTNREELLQAVSYFDSLTIALNDNSQPRNRHCGLDPQSPEHNDNLTFLTARAHYINGAGYYEKDSVVQACAEYLKALETMEEHFEEQELVGKKAQFMTYIYNRLGDMFGEQLLAESAITCYKQALLYSKREPTSIYGIPVLLYNLGIQYDVSRQIDSAYFYYNEALANLPDHDNIHYRDIMSTMALLDHYDFGLCSDSIIKDLKYIISISADEDERITRLLTLGNILYEDKQFDSARLYLEYVFEQQENNASKIMAAENLCSIYQIEGDSIKEHKYASFLASFTLMEIEKKTDASKVNELFKNYLIKKQEKQAEIARKKAVKKALEVSIPIAVVIALAILIMAKLRSKKLLKEQQEEADRMLGETEQQHKEELRQRQAEAEKALKDKEKHHQQEMEAKEAQARKELEERDKRLAEVLEAERQTHRMEQAAISGRLKRSNQEVRELKDQIKQLDDLAAKTEVAASFDEEPICRLIMDRVNEGQFKSKIDYIIYKDSALDKQQLLDLRLAVDRHFGQFTARLKKAYPELTNSDLDYCCLYLLGLTDADIAALMQRTYNTVFERNGKMRKIFGSETPLPITLMGMANDSSFI
jgi:tetratricopeptide (TPR) repeat protein